MKLQTFQVLLEEVTPALLAVARLEAVSRHQDPTE